MTAMDFTITDCNGSGPHHLYSDLNSGKVVIIEYFMTSCSPCIVAGNALESMKTKLLQQYPGKIKAYAFGFNNSYSCGTVNNWVTTNSITSIPSDSGATQVAYYGGMGMPTIIIAGGINHQLLGAPYVGFTVSDTTQMAANIRSFLSQPQNVSEHQLSLSGLSIYPNPTEDQVHISFVAKTIIPIQISIYDITGRIVREQNHITIPGSNTINLHELDLANGNYTIRFKTDSEVLYRRLSVIQ